MENFGEVFRSKILGVESCSQDHIKLEVFRKGNDLSYIIHTIEL